MRGYSDEDKAMKRPNEKNSKPPNLENKKGSKKNVPIFEIFFGLCDVISLLAEMPWKLFHILVIVSVIGIFTKIGIMIKDLKRILKIFCKEYKQLLQGVQENEKVFNNYFYFFMKLVYKAFVRIKNTIVPQLIKIGLSAIILIIFCMTDPSNREAFAQWLNFDPTQVVEKPIQDKEETDEIDIENSDKNDEEEQQKEVLIKRKAENYNFILLYPDKEPKLEKEIESQVYFWYIGAYGENLCETIQNYFESLRIDKKQGINPEELSDKSGKTGSDLEKDEVKFKHKVEACRNIENEAEWIKEAPDSDELDDYIDGRRQLNSMKIDGAQGCYILCWRLANDYQYYALEYEAQTENAQAIYYYYSMSIYYCMEAMKYDITDSERAEAENYLLSRYEDLARGDCIVDKEYKERAGEIAEILKDIL